MRRFAFFFQLLFAFYVVYGQETGTITDSRDGQTYNIVKIGNQWWMAENLNYYTNRGSWCYDYKNSNCEKYGKLYNWETAKKACPDGWHLPSDSEWFQLENHLDIIQNNKNSNSLTENNKAGGILKSVSGWDSPNSYASNISGFSAIPGGVFRIYYEQFYDLGKLAFFWTSSSANFDYSWARTLSNRNGDVYRVNWMNGHGFSVRCIKNYSENSKTKQSEF